MRLRNVTRFKIGKPGEVTVFPNQDKDVEIQLGKTRFILQSESPVTVKQVYHAST